MGGLMRFASWSVLVLALSLAAATRVVAQAWPAKTVRMVVGFSPGGGGDVSARLLTGKLSEYLGQQVIVENRAGAGGLIATELVARAPADGYTLLYAAGAFAATPALKVKPSYDPVRDFVPVAQVVVTAFTLAVHPSVPVRDVKSLVALARARPGGLTFSSPGVGSSAHLAGELFNMMAHTRMLHVPYKGAPEAATAVAAGEIDVGLPSVTAALPLLAAKKLRLVAVSSAKRSALLPAIPTLDESGLRGYERGGWNGALAPAGTPKDIVARLNALIVKIAAAAEMQQAFTKLGFEVKTGTPEAFGAFIRNEMEQNAKLVKFAGLKPD